MQQLSGLDAAFLAMESDHVHGHVGSVCLLDPSSAPGPLTPARLRAHVASRLALAPLLRRRLVTVPFGLDQPYWVDGDPPDLDHHVRELALPGPGDDHQLAVAIGRLHGRPLDRARPLWELWLVTGLDGGRLAVYSKIHHAAMDGVSGDDLLAALLDLTPEGRVVEPTAVRASEPMPGAAELLARSAASFLRQPGRALRLGAGVLASGRALALAGVDRVPFVDRWRHQDVAAPHAGLRAPRTPFNAAIGAQRRFAFADLSLTEVKQVKDRAGLTVNDVVMAVCAGALRRWLLAHDALPDEPLIAAVPVSIRGAGKDDVAGNRVSVTLAVLPTHIDTAAGRLVFAGAAMRSAKSEHSAIPENLFGDVAAFALPILAEPAWRISSALRLLERLGPFNLFVSNVRGPGIPLYYAGALLLGYYPASAVADGQGLNITVMSYCDRLCFGLVAGSTLVPDLEDVASWLDDELCLLLDEPSRS